MEEDYTDQPGIYGLVRRRRYTLRWGCRNYRGRRDDTLYLFTNRSSKLEITEEVAKSKFEISLPRATVLKEVALI